MVQYFVRDRRSTRTRTVAKDVMDFWIIVVTLLLIEKVRSLSTLQKDPSVVSLSDWDINKAKRKG